MLQLRCKPILGAIFLLTTLSDAGCPVGFTGSTSGCYYIGTSRIGSATDAFKKCYTMGGYLLNVNSRLEYSYIKEKIANKRKVFTSYWIGGKYNGQDWVWERKVNDQIITESMNEEATFWGRSEPGDDVINQRCMAIMVSGRPDQYFWYSESKNWTPNTTWYELRV